MLPHRVREAEAYATYHPIWRAHERYQRGRTARRIALRLGVLLALAAWLTGAWPLWLVLGGAVLLCGRTPRVHTTLAILLALGTVGCAPQMNGLACAMGYRPTTIEGHNLCVTERREAP